MRNCRSTRTSKTRIPPSPDFYFYIKSTGGFEPQCEAFLGSSGSEQSAEFFAKRMQFFEAKNADTFIASDQDNPTLSEFLFLYKNIIVIN